MFAKLLPSQLQWASLTDTFDCILLGYLLRTQENMSKYYQIVYVNIQKRVAVKKYQSIERPVISYIINVKYSKSTNMLLRSPKRIIQLAVAPYGDVVLRDLLSTISVCAFCYSNKTIRQISWNTWKTNLVLLSSALICRLHWHGKLTIC